MKIRGIVEDGWFATMFGLTVAPSKLSRYTAVVLVLAPAERGWCTEAVSVTKCTFQAEAKRFLAEATHNVVIASSDHELTCGDATVVRGKYYQTSL